MSDHCPHCGSEDFGTFADHHPHVCLTCGYDDEHGAAAVCPGGRHPNDRGQLCCDECWKRIPTHLPDQPRWRSRLAHARRYARGMSYIGWDEAEKIHEAVRAWLADHPRETSNP